MARTMSRGSRFCPQGHDKDIVGRDSRGCCRECRRERNRHANMTPEQLERKLKRARQYRANNPDTVRATGLMHRRRAGRPPHGPECGCVACIYAHGSLAAQLDLQAKQYESLINHHDQKEGVSWQ